MTHWQQKTTVRAIVRAGGDADEDGVCDDFEVEGCDNMLACTTTR